VLHHECSGHDQGSAGEEEDKTKGEDMTDGKIQNAAPGMHEVIVTQTRLRVCRYVIMLIAIRFQRRPAGLAQAAFNLQLQMVE
jgi:hypothetical protein